MKFYNLSSLQMIIFFISSINLPWLLQQVHASANETDRLALLEFKNGISSDPYGFFNSWNDSVPFCNWNGVSCHHQRATSLDLQGQKLIGYISPYIGNLSFLRSLDLRNNSFHGYIPQQVGNLFRLQLFLVGNNSLEGEIPSNLSHCSQLRIIDLSVNQVGGKIPAEFGSLAKLQILILALNNIRGEIPSSIANLSSLTVFSVTRNNLVGKIPDEIGRLTRLTFFTVAGNNLSGIIPPSLFNISSIVFISTAANQLNGTVPQNIGLTLPNIQQLFMAGNRFSGSIPNSLSNASHLQIFDAALNNFEGQIPILGNHPNLSWLDVSQNNLGTKSANDLAFVKPLKNSTNLEILDISNNHFGGVLPNSIANLSIQLKYMKFGGNWITGIIPEALENFVNLIDLGLEDNFFTGFIPSYFGKFQKLQRLLLRGNRLSGRIPSSLGNLTQLSVLILSLNKFEGNIPSSIGNCRGLNYLDVSRNSLNGQIPEELTSISSLSRLLNLKLNLLTGNLPAGIGKLKNINTLDVSGNNLSGEIPTTIGNCLGLEYLYMYENSFQGAIPSSLASLRGLQELDLSRNNLTGEIPQDLQNLTFLLHLNLSFNHLEGKVPTTGVFRNASAFSLIGNAKLCGGGPELLLPKCPTEVKKKGKSLAFKLAVIISCGIVLALLLMLVVLVLVYRRKKSEKRPSATPLMMDQPVKVSYQELHQTTNGFSSDKLIGSGSFGSVYKGFLNQLQKPVAIKVLKLQRKGSSKSFKAECKALRNVRHRNLVKLLTYCSSLDYKLNEFKALIFEFMGMGSLENWLHHRNNGGKNQLGNLTLLERLNIAIDVASAIHYLHDLCESPIIHCDLKPSNILLDDGMVAHVCDFGLAFFLTTNDGSQDQTSSIGIRGTIGYAPPEYGMGGVASKEGDVYSFGILVLELFSGKRPTDRMFENGISLHNFVKNALPERLVQIIDPTLLPGEIEQMRTNEKECLLSVLKVGVACSTELPKERMNMGDVAKQLHLFRSTFHGVSIYS